MIMTQKNALKLFDEKKIVLHGTMSWKNGNFPLLM